MRFHCLCFFKGIALLHCFCCQNVNFLTNIYQAMNINIFFALMLMFIQCCFKISKCWWNSSGRPSWDAAQDHVHTGDISNNNTWAVKKRRLSISSCRKSNNHPIASAQVDNNSTEEASFAIPFKYEAASNMITF
ncbi:hypothetical protein O6H91_Y538000 [Diphasiastrum complanatum]|nr:hypothetical protein O6H91_Y538000 [Diphasiastrum complanatum]